MYDTSIFFNKELLKCVKMLEMTCHKKSYMNA